MTKLKIFLLILGVAFLIGPATAVLAQSQNTPDLWGNNASVNQPGWNGANTIQNTTGLGNKDPRAIATGIINVILGFVGIIAVILIIVGGFKWMTAGGNEDKVDEAKRLMIAGVTGLAIVLAAFGISVFVVNNLIKVTS